MNDPWLALEEHQARDSSVLVEENKALHTQCPSTSTLLNLGPSMKYIRFRPQVETELRDMWAGKCGYSESIFFLGSK